MKIESKRNKSTCVCLTATTKKTDENRQVKHKLNK